MCRNLPYKRCNESLNKKGRQTLCFSVTVYFHHHNEKVRYALALLAAARIEL